MFTIGFTGTRHGMTETQFEVVQCLVQSAHIRHGTYIRGVHGDCLGADIQFHEICAFVGIPIILRPCIIDKWRAFLGTDEAVRLPEEFDGRPRISKIHVPDDPFCRNRRIVADSHVMIAAPITPSEQPRGGTWQTIRQSRKFKPPKPMFIVSPRGSVRVEQGTLLKDVHRWWELPDIELEFDGEHK